MIRWAVLSTALVLAGCTVVYVALKPESSDTLHFKSEPTIDQGQGQAQAQRMKQDQDQKQRTQQKQ